MSLSLVTGYAGKPHVKSSQDGAFNAAVYGTGKYVFDIGNQFTHEIISNNIVRVKDGYALNQGRFMGMETGDYEDVTIDNGLQGVKRSDLITMRYTLNPDTGIETAELVVIKGTSGDVYSDPESVEGDILNGASEDDFLLYRVKIDGINISAVEPLFIVSHSATVMINNTKDSTVSFTSDDNEKPTKWTDVSVLKSGEKHSSIFNKISTMFKNIRWLYKMLGTADISAIGGGTVTGAISALNTNLTSIWKTIYPVGSIYISVSSTNPASLFGGTWVQLKDRFLLGAGTSYSAGATGGESTHILTESEMPKHQHTMYGAFNTNYAVQAVASGNQGWTAKESGTSYSGGGAAHNNMPPYLVVYMWKRTA